MSPIDIEGWHQTCGLPVTRAGTARTTVQGGDELRIPWAGLRRWIADNPHLIDLRKVHPQRQWFIALLAGSPDKSVAMLARYVEGQNI